MIGHVLFKSRAEWLVGGEKREKEIKKKKLDRMHVEKVIKPKTLDAPKVL